LVERTLFIIKPDAVRRGLSSGILKDLKDSGMKILTQKKITPSVPLLERLYIEHLNKPFYGSLLNFMTSGPAICGVLEGVDAVSRFRALMGDTYPSKALPDSIRGKYRAESDTGPSGAIENMIHGSDSAEKARTEIEIFFGRDWAV
jgi:nucleoside-diphosphate kinase